MTDLAIVLGLLFFLICVFFVVVHSSLMKKITLLDWSVLGMGGVYGIGWCVIAGVTEIGGNPNWENWILPYKDLYPVHTILAFVLLGSMWIGWLVFGSLTRARIQVIPFTTSQNDYLRLLEAMWFLLIIAFIMQWLYTLAYGGFLGLLDYSRSIRSAIFPIENRLSFLRPFGGLALFASYGFWGLWLARYRRMATLFGLILSIIFSFYILYSWMGRIGFLTYLMTFVLGMFLIRKPRPLSLLVSGSMMLFTILLGAYFVSIWFNLKPSENFALFLARELSFPFGSFFGQLDYGENLTRWFKDLFVAPIYLLPSSLWSNWIENVGQVNTALIMGAPKGEQGVTGAIPVDLLTLGLMQASVYGIVVVGFIFGAFLRLAQHLINKFTNPGMHAVFEAYIAVKIAVLGVFYAQPALVVSGNFAFLFALIVIIFFVKMPRFKWINDRNNSSAILTTNQK
jgi:hypothetical protein